MSHLFTFKEYLDILNDFDGRPPEKFYDYFIDKLYSKIKTVKSFLLRVNYERIMYKPLITLGNKKFIMRKSKMKCTKFYTDIIQTQIKLMKANEYFYKQSGYNYYKNIMKFLVYKFSNINEIFPKILEAVYDFFYHLKVDPFDYESKEKDIPIKISNLNEDEMFLLIPLLEFAYPIVFIKTGYCDYDIDTYTIFMLCSHFSDYYYDSNHKYINECAIENISVFD